MITKKSTVITYRYTVGVSNPMYEIICERMQKGEIVGFPLEINAMLIEFKGTPAIADYEKAYKEKFVNLFIKLISATDICLTYEAQFINNEYFE